MLLEQGVVEAKIVGTIPNELIKRRLTQVFQYLKALNEHRHPLVKDVRHQPWLFWLDSLPVHETIEFKNSYKLVFGESADRSEETNVIKGSEPIL